jgi:hypothetical protein
MTLVATREKKTRYLDPVHDICETSLHPATTFPKNNHSQQSKYTIDCTNTYNYHIYMNNNPINARINIARPVLTQVEQS